MFDGSVQQRCGEQAEPTMRRVWFDGPSGDVEFRLDHEVDDAQQQNTEQRDIQRAPQLRAVALALRAGVALR